MYYIYRYIYIYKCACYNWSIVSIHSEIKQQLMHVQLTEAYTTYDLALRCHIRENPTPHSELVRIAKKASSFLRHIAFIQISDRYRCSRLAQSSSPSSTGHSENATRRQHFPEDQAPKRQPHSELDLLP